MKRGMKPEKALKIKIKQGLKPTKLQNMRVKKGLSQSELAEKINVSVRRIQHYEQGVKPIDGARIEVLCDLSLALDCKIEDILENNVTIEKLKKCK